MVILPHRTFDEVRNKPLTSTNVLGMSAVKIVIQIKVTIQCMQGIQFLCCGKYFKDNKHSNVHLTLKKYSCIHVLFCLWILQDLFLEAHSFCLSDQITSADKFPLPAYFLCRIEAIVIV